MYTLRRALSCVYEAIEQVSIFKNDPKYSEKERIMFTAQPLSDLEAVAKRLNDTIIELAEHSTKESAHD